MSNALKGIGKLQSLSDTVIGKNGEEISGMREGFVSRGENGFGELLKVIQENVEIRDKKDEIQRISLIEKNATIQVPGRSPDRERVLLLVTEDKEASLTLNPFDPDKPIRELTNWVEENLRRQLAYWMSGVLVIWLVANSYMLYFLNK